MPGCLVHLCNSAPEHPPTCPLHPIQQRKSLRAAAAALAALTEADDGLAVDPDVAEEAQRQRARCSAHLQRARAGRALPAAAPTQPAELAGAAADKQRQLAGESGPGGGEGPDTAAAGRPYAVEMFGLRKVYKVRATGDAWPDDAA